ncbi:MAG: SurA N-terminal domain-containing protein [Spirochaetota bacterium]
MVFFQRSGLRSGLRFLYVASAMFQLFFSPAMAEIVNGIACKVGNEIITLNEFNRAYSRMKKQAEISGAQELAKKEVMEILINNLLVKKEAEKRGIIVTNGELDEIIKRLKEQHDLTEDEFLEELEHEGITLKELREQYRIELLKTKLINYMIASEAKIITDYELREFYDKPENRDLFNIPSTIELAQIYIPVPEDVSYLDALEIKKRAVNIYEEAKKSSNFEKLVLEYSMAPGKEKNRGYLGSFTKEQLLSLMNAEQVDLLFSLSAGEIAPPIRFREGYYIFKVLKKIEQKQVSFEQAYEKVKSYYLKIRGEKVFNSWLFGARQATNIQYVLDME